MNTTIHHPIIIILKKKRKEKKRRRGKDRKEGRINPFYLRGREKVESGEWIVVLK